MKNILTAAIEPNILPTGDDFDSDLPEKCRSTLISYWHVNETPLAPIKVIYPKTWSITALLWTIDSGLDENSMIFGCYDNLNQFQKDCSHYGDNLILRDSNYESA